jgi:hypothetical protein
MRPNRTETMTDTPPRSIVNMKLKSLSPDRWPRRGATLALVAAASAALAHDSSVVRLPLQNTGVDSDATGAIVSVLKPKSSFFSVKATRLTPGQSYTLTVADLPEASVTANSKGRVALTFATPAKGNRLLLDFDPRGQRVALSDGTNAVLAAVVSGADEPTGSRVDERADLTRLAGAGEAKARYHVLANGRRFFIVKLERVTGTNWSLYVNGIWRGDIHALGRETTVIFDTQPPSPNRRLLDFDPRGQVIDLAQGGDLMFSGKLEAKAGNVNVATPSVARLLIPSTGADADGTARAKVRVESDARRKFSVELEDVPAGAYELLVNDVLHGAITVAATADGTEGEIEFSSREDDGDELPLTFDPTNSTFTVQSGGTVYFQGRLTGSGGGSGSNEPPVRIEENLASTRLDPDADGDAKFEIDDRGRRKFSVEIEDVAVGAYELWVGGVKRGTIRAALQATQVEGEIEFEDDDDNDHLPLNFDPRGQLIEVKSAAGVFFSHLFGLGPADGGTNTTLVMPLRLEVPLFNLGVAANASAKAEFKRDDRGRRGFEVEIEDAPLGNYTLRVGGAAVGTISVLATAGGTEGRIEFEDDDDDGHPPLTFDPLGISITVSREGVDYFQRTFPTAH